MKRNKLKLLIFSVLGLFSTNSIFAAEFHPDSIYSRWIINSRMGDFRNKSQTNHFKTPTTERNIEWDYVPGLVAKAIIMTWEYYKDQSWSTPYYTAIEDNNTRRIFL